MNKPLKLYYFNVDFLLEYDFFPLETTELTKQTKPVNTSVKNTNCPPRIGG